MAFGRPLPDGPDYLKIIAAETTAFIVQCEDIRRFVRGADRYQREVFREGATREVRIRADRFRERAVEEIEFAMATRRKTLDLTERHITAGDHTSFAAAIERADAAMHAVAAAMAARVSKERAAELLPTLELLMGPVLAMNAACERIRAEALRKLDPAAKPPGKKRGRPPLDERNAKIKEMRARGMEVYQIASAMEVSESTVRNVLNPKKRG